MRVTYQSNYHTPYRQVQFAVCIEWGGGGTGYNFQTILGTIWVIWVTYKSHYHTPYRQVQ